MVNLVISFFSVIIIFFGLISMVTPIPGGTILIASGLTALICSSPTARYRLMRIRSKVNWFNKVFFWLEQKVGGKVKFVGVALSKTHPKKIEH